MVCSLYHQEFLRVRSSKLVTVQFKLIDRVYVYRTVHTFVSNSLVYITIPQNKEKQKLTETKNQLQHYVCLISSA